MRKTIQLAYISLAVLTCLFVFQAAPQAIAQTKKSAPAAKAAPAAPAAQTAPAGPSGSAGGEESSSFEGIGSGAERVNVDTIKEKYWARGDESALGVVQNRLYSKEKKLEIGLLGGILADDPFFSTKILGGRVGFHFSEYLALHFIGWKDFVSESGSFQDIKSTLTAQVSPALNNNTPRYYIGTEINFSMLYGKLSLLGSKIIYYDLHLIGGLGLRGMEYGNSGATPGNVFCPSLGIGQRFYVTPINSIRFDYRVLMFKQSIYEETVSANLGQFKGDRTNYSHTLALSIDFLFNLGGE